MGICLSLTTIGAFSVFAANGTITITPPEGVEATATNTYKIYRVFDAVGDGTNISYKLVTGKTTVPAGFSIDSAGNVTYTGNGVADTNGVVQLTAADITAIQSYITDSDFVEYVTSTGSANAVSSSLPNGYYYITTSTGSLVTIDSTNPSVTVKDKNTIPGVDKKITSASDVTNEGKKALAQIGTDVEYTATVTVGKGSKNLVFHDKMETGLTFKGNSNVVVTAAAPANGTAPNGTWYTIKDTPDTGDTLTITFVDGIAEGTVITIKYIATINADALTSLDNDVYLTYGDNNSTTHSTTEVYNAQIRVVKYDGNNTPADTSDDTLLGGAKFVLARTKADNSLEYYKLTGTVVTWVSNIADATLRTSQATTGLLDEPFTGLANGTYTLIETEAPTGFNKAGDQTITINSGDYNAGEGENLNQGTNVLNNKGSVLPSTGGIGTTIFYIIGAILVAGAVILLVTKRRMNAE